MYVDVVSGPGKVIASDMVTTLWGNELELRVAYGPQPFRLVLGFRSDPDIEGVAVETSWPGGGLRFELVNFDGPDGRGTAEPTLLTEVGDDLLFMHFRVFRFGETTDRTVHYTLYAVPKARVGWRPSGAGGEHQGPVVPEEEGG